MKIRNTRTLLTLLFLVAAAALPALGAQAAQLARLELSDPVAASRGQHHTIWERTYNETGPKGRVFQKKKSYTQIATGLNRWSAAEGKFVPSSVEFEIVDGAAVARKGAHVLSLAPNLNAVGAVDITTPDGQRLRSTVTGLALWDPASGKSEFIAQLKDVEGKIVSPREVLYENAFIGFGENSGLQAHVRYLYTLRGMEQDVIISDQVVLPDGYAPATTEMQVWTEFFDAPNPRQHQRTLDGATDVTLAFGKMRMTPGKAFAVDGAPGWSTGVAKQWVQIGTRRFLVERVKWQAIQPALRDLPRPKRQASVKTPTTGEQVRVNKDQTILVPAVISRTASLPRGSVQMAALNPAPKGLVIDYILVSSDTLTLEGDKTYYVSEPVVVDSLTVEGNTVVKYAVGASIEIVIGGTIHCQTGPYRHAVFTSVDDDSAGEVIGYGPPTGHYASAAFILHDAEHLVRYVRIAYAQKAFLLDDGILTLEHSQIYGCGQVMVHTSHSWAGYFNNVLLANNANILQSSGNAHITARHITVDVCLQFNNSAAGSTLNIINSIVANMSSWGAGSRTETAVSTVTSADFQTAVGGAHYLLDPNNTLRNTASGTISEPLLSALKAKTTFPPDVRMNVSLNTDETFPPAAARDNDGLLDRGYHYDPLDYAFGGVDVNANITFAPGVAVGWFRTSSGWYHAGHGIHMADQKILTFNGTATAPAWWVRCNVVQEGGTGIGEGGYGPGGITGWADQWAENIELSPEVRATFTRFSMLAGDGNHARDDWGYLIVRARDCEFYSGGLGGYVISCYLDNCLFDRTYVAQVAGLPGNEFHLRNCTFNGSRIDLDRWYTWPPMPASIKDCAFDKTQFYVDAYGNTDFDYNAYVITVPQQSLGGFTDLPPVPAFDWQTGTFGKWYLPANSPLIDVGSRTPADAGLFHYTVKTGNVKEGAETEEIVDIGYHYVAANSSTLQPLDSDGDGFPDYSEDVNGNGGYEFAGDGTDWSKWDTDADGLSDSQETQGGTNPEVAECPRKVYEDVIDSQIPARWFKLNGSLADSSGTVNLTASPTSNNYTNDAFFNVNGARWFNGPTHRLLLTETDDPIGGGSSDLVQQGSFSLLFRALSGQASSSREHYLISQGTDVTANNGNAIGVYFTTAGDLKLRVGFVEDVILNRYDDSDGVANDVVYGAWYYLAVTCDESLGNDEVRWYLGRVGSQTLQSEPLTLGTLKKFGNNGNITIGNDEPTGSGFDNGYGNPGVGLIDQVTFWRRTLTPSEVAAQFNAVSPSSIPASFLSGTPAFFYWNLLLPVSGLNQLEDNDPMTPTTPLTLPPYEVSTGWMNSGFKFVDPAGCTRKYFYRDGNTLVFETPWNGAVQPNSPRSELRGTKADGTEDNWKLPERGGIHTLQATCAVNEAGLAGNSKVIIGQIHGKLPDEATFTVNYNFPNPKDVSISFKSLPSGGTDNHRILAQNVNLNAKIQYNLRVSDNGTTVTLHGNASINDVPQPPPSDVTLTSDPSTMNPWRTATFYFKVGCYYPNSPTDGTAKVTFSSFSATPGP